MVAGGALGEIVDALSFRGGGCRQAGRSNERTITSAEQTSSNRFQLRPPTPARLRWCVEVYGIIAIVVRSLPTQP